MTPTIRLTPETPDKIANILRQAQDEGWRLALSHGEAADLPQPRWLDVSRLNRVLKYNPGDLTIKVQPGMTMGELAKETLPHGQRLALSYPDGMTLLEVLAGDCPAPETGVLGYPRDYVLGLEIATPDGDITKCGGEVVKNVTGYDLNKLYVGSRNTLGVITSVALKLSGVPEEARALSIPMRDPKSGLELAMRWLASALPITNGALVYEGGRGQLLVLLSGYRALVDAAQQAINASLKEAGLSPAAEMPVSELVAMQFPKETMPMVMEAAFPPGDAAFGFAACRKILETFKPDWSCVNIAAGLVWVGWAAMPADTAAFVKTMRELSHELHVDGGFAQLLRFAPGAPLNALAYELNLPPDEMNRQLMKRFKALYDPHGVLYSRVLPLAGPMIGAAV